MPKTSVEIPQPTKRAPMVCESGGSSAARAAAAADADTAAADAAELAAVAGMVADIASRRRQLKERGLWRNGLQKERACKDVPWRRLWALCTDLRQSVSWAGAAGRGESLIIDEPRGED